MKLALILAASILAAGPARADEKTVGDLVVDLGLMPAWKAMEVDGHREAHSHSFVSKTGSQHLLVVVAYKKTGKHLGDAQVFFEVIDP